MANIALASAGSSATASSSYIAAGFSPAFPLDGNKNYTGNDTGGCWASSAAPSSGSPETYAVDFGQSRTFDRVDIYFLPDGAANGTPTSASSNFACRDFKLQYWNGSAWIDIAGASATGNTSGYKTFSFTSVTATKLRLYITQGATSAGGSLAYVLEIEAYEAADTTAPSDVVLGAASALSAISARFPFTPSTDASGIQKYKFELDTVTTFNSGNLIQVDYNGTASPFDKTGLQAGLFYYARAKAVDNSPNHNQSANWSNVVGVQLPVPPPAPTVLPVNPVPSAQIGQPFSIQLNAAGGSGSGTWSKVSGSGAVAANGVFTINPVPSVNIAFTARYTDANGTFDDETFTIPVSEYAWILLCHKRPLPRKIILNQRIFTPLEGAEEVVEDAAPKYEYSIQNLYIGRTNGDALRDFLFNHRKRQPFLWYNPDRGETKLVKLMSGYDEEEMLSYGGFQIVLRDV